MVELTLLCVAANAEAVSDALIDEHGALSASVEDADAGTDAEQALFGEPGMAPPGSWDRSVVKALFLQADVAHRAMNDLRTDWKSAVLLRSIEPVPDRDWVTLTQAQFAPTEIAPSAIPPTASAPVATARRARGEARVVSMPRAVRSGRRVLCMKRSSKCGGSTGPHILQCAAFM